MAKQQNIALNAAKISGNCGRLMCCLKYEQEAYEEKLARLPKIGAIVKTEDGQGEVCGIETLKERVKVKLKDGDGFFYKRYDLKDSYYKKEFIDAALDRIKEIKDSVDKELYLEKLSDKVRIDVDILKRKLTGDIKDVYQKRDKEEALKSEQENKENKRTPASIQREENEKKMA